MTRAFSKKPAKTIRRRVTFIGPKGGYHHIMYTLKLWQKVTTLHSLNTPRGMAITEKAKANGWILSFVEWYNSATRSNFVGEPNEILIYRAHKNDVYNSRLVKPGWRIVG